jgi:asparagine synthetase B (glutamine-hydrolysing)
VCGIAGYSIAGDAAIDRTLAAQALLAGIAERGADAVGVAHRAGGPSAIVTKQQTGASALLETLSLPVDARHVAVVGVHNGIIENDDALFAQYGIERAHPEMTVDSEAIFALVNRRPDDLTVLEELRGAMATAWLDERDTETLHLARGLARPLWIGRGRQALFFASTRAALELVEQTLRISLRLDEVTEARKLEIVDGRIVHKARFRPDRRYRPAEVLPSVRAPHEGARCVARLAALAALA